MTGESDAGGPRILRLRSSRILRRQHHPATWALVTVLLLFSTCVSLIGATGPTPPNGFRTRAGGEKSELQRAADFAAAAGFRTEFVGYEKTEALTQVGAVAELGEGLVLAKLRESPFYPAGGGRFVASLQPCPQLGRLDLLRRGALVARRSAVTRTISAPSR